MIASRHILGTFDEALASLRNNVLMMSSLTERSLERAMKGLFNRDDDLCAHAIADDEEIDQLEIQIDKDRSEEHTSELQSLTNLVCRLLLEKKKKKKKHKNTDKKTKR